MKVRKLVLHCNGYDGRTWRDILRTHLGKGWFGIGYHAVGHEDGSVHPGRKETKPGAHAPGLNPCSLAYCMIGDLDAHPPTPAQWESAVNWFAIRALRHGLSSADVIGHREAHLHGGKRTKKSCPGALVRMNWFRDSVGFRMGALRREHERAIMNCPGCRILPFSATAAVTAREAGYKLLVDHAAFARPCKEHKHVA